MRQKKFNPPFLFLAGVALFILALLADAVSPLTTEQAFGIAVAVFMVCWFFDNISGFFSSDYHAPDEVTHQPLMPSNYSPTIVFNPSVYTEWAVEHYEFLRDEHGQKEADEFMLTVREDLKDAIGMQIKRREKAGVRHQSDIIDMSSGRPIVFDKARKETFEAVTNQELEEKRRKIESQAPTGKIKMEVKKA